MENKVACPKCKSEKVSTVGDRRYKQYVIEQDYKCECGHDFTDAKNREEAKHRGN